MAHLAAGYLVAGKLELALPLLEDTLKRRKAKLGPDHPDTLSSMGNLARGYCVAGRLDLALPLLEDALKRSQAKLGPDHPHTLNSIGSLAKACLDAKQPEKALPLFDEFVAGHRRRLGASDPGFAGGIAQVSQDLLKAKEYPAAEKLLRECLAIRVKTQSEHWTTFNTQSMLGGALLGQKQYADAEPLLLAGYAGMKKQDAKIPPQAKVRLVEAVERLVQLYEALDKQDEAAKWRAERQAIQSTEKQPEKK
jgi:hypothetical protein